MRALVVDTHALAWHLTAPEKLGKSARRLLAQADAGQAQAGVPAIVLVEMALLHERGRLRFGADRVVAALAAQPGWQVLALDIEQCMAFGELPTIKDPMDRLIAAATRAVKGATLVSCDVAFDAVKIARAWE